MDDIVISGMETKDGFQTVGELQNVQSTVHSRLHSSKFPFYFIFCLNTSDTPFSHYWILNSGATNHMNPPPQILLHIFSIS